MNRQEIQSLVDKVKYKDWRFIVGEKNGSMYLQIKFDAPDNYTGEVEEQSCRKFTLSEHMVKTEVYDTVWLAIQRAEIHEAAENYWVWDDISERYLIPECPHVSFDAKMEMARENRVEQRIDKELIKSLLEEMPVSWRDNWCGSGACACMGCANRSGGLAEKGITRNQWLQVLPEVETEAVPEEKVEELVGMARMQAKLANKRKERLDEERRLAESELK